MPDNGYSDFKNIYMEQVSIIMDWDPQVLLWANKNVMCRLQPISPLTADHPKERENLPSHGGDPPEQRLQVQGKFGSPSVYRKLVHPTSVNAYK